MKFNQNAHLITHLRGKHRNAPNKMEMNHELVRHQHIINDNEQPEVRNLIFLNGKSKKKFQNFSKKNFQNPQPSIID